MAEQAVLTRVIIQVGQVALSEGRAQAWITFCCEQTPNADGTPRPGKVFSGYYDLDRAKTVQQRRTDLRAIALAEVPGQFDGGAVQAGNFILEYLGI